MNYYVVNQDDYRLLDTQEEEVDLEAVVTAEIVVVAMVVHYNSCRVNHLVSLNDVL